MELNNIGQLSQVSQDGMDITVHLKQPFNASLAYKLSGGVTPTIALKVADNRIISPEQRAKAWILINEIAKWQGMRRDSKEVEEFMKQLAMSEHAEITEHFSLSNCSVTVARLFIETLLTFCFENDVPFATKVWDAISNDYFAQKKCLEHRECVICRRRAQYAHVETVGMGMSRKKIDHSKHRFMALCAIHHSEQHTIGINTFISKHHIKPISLNYDELVKLGIMQRGNAYWFKEQQAEVMQHETDGN